MLITVKYKNISYMDQTKLNSYNALTQKINDLFWH